MSLSSPSSFPLSPPHFAGHSMNRGRHIPWFNPREMDDVAVLALNTGREPLLRELRQLIAQRSRHPGHFGHWLLTGPRGAGKSFFLRLVQASMAHQPIAQVRFVLLPEELPNVYAPHELLGEIERMLSPSGRDQGAIPMWRVPDAGALWEQAQQQLLAAFHEPLLVVGIENMDRVLAQAFANDVDNSRLRHLMSNEPRIMLLATALQGRFNENTSQPLFRQFEHHALPGWNAQDHRSYLRARAQQQGSAPRARQLNRIDAYSRYTGGNPRAAAVLAATILDVDDLLKGADDLDAAIEKMSDYYRALIERIPVNTRKLFDALVRGGEPASQTDLAARTGARQNDIGRAFSWLLDNGYVSERQEAGSKNKQYRILDRLLVQFYRMRYLHPGQPSRLSAMADLLADMLSYSEKWHFAGRYLKMNNAAEAQTLVELALQERQIDLHSLPAAMQSVPSLIAEQVQWAQHDVNSQILKNGAPDYGTLLAKFANNDALQDAIDNATTLARACACGSIQGGVLVALITGHWGLIPLEKYRLFAFMVGPVREQSTWQALQTNLENALAEFKKLEATAMATFSNLQSFNQLSCANPLTASLHALSKQDSSNLTVPAYTAAHWAIRAAIGWQHIGNTAYLHEAFDTFCLAAERSLRTEWAPQELLPAFALLEALMPALSLRQQAHALAMHGVLLIHLGQAQAALHCHEKAQQICLQLPQASFPTAKHWATFNVEQMAWNCSALGNVSKAIALHHIAATERIKQTNFEEASWNLGQIARHRVVQNGVASAWHELNTALQAIQTDGVWAVQQFGSAVADACNSKLPSHGFVIGMDILYGLAQRPDYPAEAVLRGLWINMVEMKVPFTLLQDLLGEWPHLWPHSAHGNIITLQKVLQTLLAELALAPKARAAKRKHDDPDLAMTLAAIEQAFSPKTQHRLGLLVNTKC